jgi:hypothetical protein
VRHIGPHSATVFAQIDLSVPFEGAALCRIVRSPLRSSESSNGRVTFHHSPSTGGIGVEGQFHRMVGGLSTMHLQALDSVEASSNVAVQCRRYSGIAARVKEVDIQAMTDPGGVSAFARSLSNKFHAPTRRRSAGDTRLHWVALPDPSRPLSASIALCRPPAPRTASGAPAPSPPPPSGRALGSVRRAGR